MLGSADLGDTLAGLTREGTLYARASDAPEDTSVRCFACAHTCHIHEGRAGICRLRLNRGGKLLVPHGYVSGIACDPIEKKPFYHVLAGKDALSYGMLGCNFHCPFCQNWTTSQALRDPEAGAAPQRCTARDLVGLALRRGAPVISSTYNEPLVTSEWSWEVFRLAKANGLFTCYVSNGFASPRVLDYLHDCLDAMNVDLKCFTEEGYARLGGRLQPVLDTIRALYEGGTWVEVITLVVPEFNDSEGELRDIAGFLASVSPDIPWHVTAYHADYRMSGGVWRTPPELLQAAIAIGREAGIRYVYGGNVPGLGRDEDTRCHGCGSTLIERHGFTVRRNRLKDGRCPDCGVVIPGRWG